MWRRVRDRPLPGWQPYGLRGRGIGTQLLDFVDRELASRSIEGLKIAVMVGNDDAQRLYERRGLRPAEIVLYRVAAGGGTA